MAASVSNGDCVQRVRDLVRDVPDFPAPGVVFKDLTPVLADAAAFRSVVEGLAAMADRVDAVVGVEARGFVLGGAVAHAVGAGVVGLRKPGKLPAVADRESYALEYGSATLELPDGALRPGARVLVVDDVLATGGTVDATCRLTERAGADVTGVAVALEIEALAGRAQVSWPVDALLRA